MKYTLSILLFLLFQGCHSRQKTATSLKADSEKVSISSPKSGFKNISQVMADTDIQSYWRNQTNGYPALHFSESRDTVRFEFNGQCDYSYPIKTMGDQTFLMWDTIENCTYGIGIKNTFGLKDHPIVGKPFVRLDLVNDSTLEATYLYPEWTGKFNQQWKEYSYFPSVFENARHE